MSQRYWVATTTLNDNLLRASFLPLHQAFPDIEFLFVTDRIGAPMPGVRYEVPSKVMSMILGRVLARWMLLFRVCARRSVERIEVFNAIPHLILVWWPAKLFRKPVDLHMFAGRYELDFADNPEISDNRIVKRLKNPIKFQNFIRRLALKNVSTFFVPGNRCRSFLNNIGVQETKIVTLHSAIDTDKYHVDENINRDIDVIIVAGMRVVKRPFLTLKVLEQVLVARPQSKFVWLGGGDLFSEVQHALEQSNLKGALTLLGHKEEVWPYYQRSKVFLLNSMSEGLSCACMETMACGVVPVSTDVGDMSEIVRENQTGVLVGNTDMAEQYSRVILQLLDNTENLRSYSKNSRALIQSEHGFTAVTEVWKQRFK